jgi:GGDEF domain-containing protein
MKGIGGIAGALGAGMVALGLSFAVFALPRNASAGIAFVAFLVVWAAVLWLAIGNRSEKRRARVERLMGVERRRPAFTIYDSVTGLCAGWYFKLRLQEEIARATRYELPLGLMLIDASPHRRDRKSIARLISAMASTFRTSDLVGHLDSGRYGVLLTNTDKESSQTARDRLLEAMQDGDTEIGLACYPDDATNWRDLLEKAGVAPAEFYGISEGDSAVSEASQNVVSIDDLRRVAGGSGRFVA